MRKSSPARPLGPGDSTVAAMPQADSLAEVLTAKAQQPDPLVARPDVISEFIQIIGNSQMSDPLYEFTHAGAQGPSLLDRITAVGLQLPSYVLDDRDGGMSMFTIEPSWGLWRKIDFEKDR